MDRREFFRMAGLGGLAAVLPSGRAAAASSTFGALDKRAVTSAGGCVLIPSETRGPYPLDLSSNASMFRQDVTEGNAGTPLNLKLTVVNVNNACAPIANARVDIWHCDKDGYYSGFSNQGYLGTRNGAGQTFFRGIQLTNTAGEVDFVTIYPGWYSGRVQHIHFEVYLSSLLNVTSQLAFPEELNTAVNNTAPYSAHGQNPTKNTNDNVFSDAGNTAYQIATVTPNSQTGGYDASLLVGIVAPVTGIINLEPETGGQFKLHPASPNPFKDATRLAFRLENPSEVRLELFNLAGKKVAEPARARMAAGERSVLIDRARLGLSKGSYVYQLTVENSNGSFRQSKLLTAE